MTYADYDWLGEESEATDRLCASSAWKRVSLHPAWFGDLEEMATQINFFGHMLPKIIHPLSEGKLYFTRGSNWHQYKDNISPCDSVKVKRGLFNSALFYPDVYFANEVKGVLKHLA